MKANGKRLMKIANLAIAMVLAIPMFILAVPFYMYNKINACFFADNFLA